LARHHATLGKLPGVPVTDPPPPEYTTFAADKNNADVQPKALLINNTCHLPACLATSSLNMRGLNRSTRVFLPRFAILAAFARPVPLRCRRIYDTRDFRSRQYPDRRGFRPPVGRLSG